MNLYLDCETYSEVSLGAHALYRYSEAVEVMLISWAIDDGPVEVEDLTEDIPWGFLRAVDLCDTFTAQNAQFDRVNLTAARINAKLAEVNRWRCTMFKALAHSLPGGLDKLCTVLHVPTEAAKHKRGRELIHSFCKPRPKNQKLRRATRLTHPAEWEEFKLYAASDITAMREVDKRLPQWNSRGSELARYHFDQKVNSRGFAIDVPLATKCRELVVERQGELSNMTSDATAGQVESTNQRDALLAHLLAEYDVTLPDMQAATLEKRLDDPALPRGAKELLKFRLQASTSSTSKYTKMLKVVSSDGRVRGALQINGAARTRRWAGRSVQPQNYPRPSMSPDVVDVGIEAINQDCAADLFDNLMELTSNTLRGTIIAAHGKKLVWSDYRNIEGRFQAWFAGEAWKLDAFRDFDAGIGHDLYKLAYSRAFAIAPEDVESTGRQIGKVMELSLGYAGGAGAFASMAVGYRMNLDELREKAWPTIPLRIRDEVAGGIEWRRKNRIGLAGMRQEIFEVCDALKRMWRHAHPAIVSCWAQLKSAISTTMATGETVRVGPATLKHSGSWLRIRLPSGNFLCYLHPAFVDGNFTYMGSCPYTRQWRRIKSHPGMVFENIVQSGSLDIMAGGAKRAEEADYPVVLTVHDEVITEPPDDPYFSARRLSDLLVVEEPWAHGLPLSAAGHERVRYGKLD